jgi:hypothetical protein
MFGNNRSQSQPGLFSAGALMNFDSYGKWVGACGKYFMFSANKVHVVYFLAQPLQPYVV